MIKRISVALKKWPWLFRTVRPVFYYFFWLYHRWDVSLLIWRIQIPSMKNAATGKTWRTKQIGACANGNEVVMLVVSDLRIDPRVEREARALADAGYVVTIICPEPSPGVGKTFNLDWGNNVHIDYIHWTASSFVLTKPGYFADQLYWEAARRKPFAFHAHDLNTAYAALAAAKFRGSHLVVDFHEWFSENVCWDEELLKYVPHPEDWRRQLQQLEIRCLTEASSTVTVCDSIADAMAAELGGRPPIVVRNIPKLDAISTKEYPSLKEQLGLPASSFVVLWQGGTGPTRMIEPIIEALVHAPRATFVIRGPSLDYYGDGYLQLARRLGVEDRLIMVGPVPSRDVVAAARGADAGIWTLPALCRNFTYALPNKIFEYIASGLPVLAAHYPEASRLISENDLGLTFDPYDPDSIASAINQLIDNPAMAARFRKNTYLVLKRLDADIEWQKLVTLYSNLPSIK